MTQLRNNFYFYKSSECESQISILEFGNSGRIVWSFGVPSYGTIWPSHGMKYIQYVCCIKRLMRGINPTIAITPQTELPWVGWRIFHKIDGIVKVNIWYRSVITFVIFIRVKVFLIFESVLFRSLHLHKKSSRRKNTFSEIWEHEANINLHAFARHLKVAHMIPYFGKRVFLN